MIPPRYGTGRSLLWQPDAGSTKPAGLVVLFKRVRVDTANLERGMYVAQLDRPWIETPFLFQVSRFVTTTS